LWPVELFLAGIVLTSSAAAPADVPIRITDENSLRAAIARHTNIQFAGNAFITFTRPIEIVSNLTLDSRGHDVVLHGENRTRLFNVATGATLTIRHLTIANGRSTNAGAIWNDGTLVLTDCAFSNNIAHGTDGTNGVDGPLSEGQTHDGTPGENARGGAIVNNGILRITNSSFIANAAIAGNGGNGTVGAEANYCCGTGGNGAIGGSASGGAIFSPGAAAFQHSRFMSNIVAGGSGGSGNVGALTNWTSYAFAQGYSGTSASGGDASGGGVALLANFSLNDCTFSNNAAIGGRGGDGASGRASWRTAGAGIDGMKGGNANGGVLFVNHTGAIARSAFVMNTAAAGDGGMGGSGGRGHISGAGGTGGDGGEAFGGAIFSTVELPIIESLFGVNSARAGKGGDGGGGGSYQSEGTGSGTGGAGGRGGGAQGGALVANGGSVSNNNFSANHSLAGGGGAGGNGGAPCSCFYGSGGSGGTGGDGGISKGGAIYFPFGRAEISISTFRENYCRSGAGGDGGVGPSAFVGYSYHGPSAGGGGSGGNAGPALGGALTSSAEISLMHSMFISNRVETSAAGSGVSGGSARYGGGGGAPGYASSAEGGAIWSANSFTSMQCFFDVNSAIAGAGGNGGSGGHSDSVFGDWSAAGAAGSAGGSAFGGALVLVSNVVEISRSTFDRNFARAGVGGNAGTQAANHGGVGISPQGGVGGDASGGSVDAVGAALLLHDSSISRSAAYAAAGGTTAPSGRTRTWNASALSGPNGGTATGGGISLRATLANVSGCTFDNNRCSGGTGGIGGTRLQGTGGGEGGLGGHASGGGLTATDGVLSITNSTFYSNSVIGGLGGIGGANNGGAPGGTGGDAFGGAIHSVTGSVVLVNASFAENFSVAGLGGSGGAGETNTMGVMGASGSAFGGALANESAEVAIVNSLFKHHAANTNAFGVFIDLGHNISSDASFAFSQSSSFSNIDPLVGPLADNGGPTRTLALLSGSPAIDAVNDEHCPPTDQRGVSRPFGAHCDIGAFEVERATFSLSGVVKERVGVPGITVSAGDVNTITGTIGAYTIRNLFAGSYLVAPRFSRAEFSPDTRAVTVGPNAANVNFTIKLSRVQTTWRSDAHGMSLRVNGLPLANYTLESSTNLSQWMPFTEARMDTNGIFELNQLVNTNEPQRYFRVVR
jgi:hypothetical protein